MYTLAANGLADCPKQGKDNKALQRTHMISPSMRARSTSCYFLAIASLLTLCVEAALGAEPDRPVPTVVQLPLKQLHGLFPELAGLKFAATQTDLPIILQQVGAREDAFLRNIPDLTASEHIVVRQQEHAEIGGPDRTVPVFSGRYTYLVLVHRESDGAHLVEYRTDLHGKEVQPGSDGAPASIQGFALIPLFFEPLHQSVATFRYLGRQVVDHVDMYVVAFAERLDEPQLTGKIQIGGKTISTAYQGIAWIDPIKFQIRQMRTDLLQPRPDVGLLAQTTEVHFTEVHLPRVGTPLWLPQSVAVSSLRSGQLIRIRHSYSNYQKFVANSRILPAN